MAFMDDIKDKANITEMKDRFEELKSQEKEGNIDEKGRAELQQLKEQFDQKKDSG
jgi:hypothetical protein